MGILFGILGGGIITIATAIFVEWLRLPKLTLEIENPYDVPTWQPPKRRLLLKNKSLPRGFRWIQRSAALQCRGEITFLNLAGQDLFDRAMTVRWANSKEPGQITGQIIDLQNPAHVQYRILDYSGIDSRMDIYPGEQEPLDVAVRFQNEADSYGWNNESYFHNWRTPDWQIPRGIHFVRVIVTSSGNRCIGRFRLLNEVDPLNGFRLTPLCDGDNLD